MDWPLIMTFEEFVYEECDIDLPEGDIPAEFFDEHHIPKQVCCDYCGKIVPTHKAFILTFDQGALCPECAGKEC